MTMTHAYKLAAAAVRRRYTDQRPETLRALRRLSKSDVAVLTGVHDSVQHVLSALGIPHTMDPKKLTQQVVFVNCAGGYDPKRGAALEAHARAGGLVVSSDWALDTIARAFPGTVRRAPKATKDEVVAVEATQGSLWDEIVVLGADPQWWLEGSSYPVVIEDSDRVRVEAASHEMLAQYDSPIVAVSFPWHAGAVFHLVSHFWLKRTRNVGGRYAGPAAEFMRTGLGLDEAAIAELTRGSAADGVNFASLQSAATSAELVARLCAEGVH
ncbi:MAG: hypothetical protein AAGE52_09850 [Myxococcota bacterium]